jgi:hemerythrin
MGFLVWGDQYKTNIAEVDAQHRKLFDMVNEMHDAMKSGKGDAVIGKTLEGLLQYCATHFATEERLMSAHGYPDYASHKKAHDELTQKTKDLEKKYKGGEPVLSFDVMDFLKKWLQNHILGTDKKFGPFLNSKGVK